MVQKHSTTQPQVITDGEKTRYVILNMNMGIFKIQIKSNLNPPI